MILNLEVDEVNQILNVLGQAPYAQVFKLIHKIQEQGLKKPEGKQEG